MHYPRGPRYDTCVFDSPSSWKTVAEPWEELGKAQDRPPQLRQHPAWLELELLGHPNREARVVALHERGALVGIVPVLLRKWGWPLRIGPRPVARLPVRLAQVIGEGLLAPPTPSALETLLESVSTAARPSDVLLLEGIPVGSPLWATIQHSPVVRRRFFVHSSGPATPRHRIVLEGTFEEYLAGRSKNTRKALARVERGLTELCGGDLAVDRITEPDQVPEFLRLIRVIAEKSWQGRSGIGRDYAPESPEALRVQACARNGWLRSYILRKGEQPLAFELAFQADGAYLAFDGGYDPEWSESSPGRFLQTRILKDLFAHDRPAEIDFGFGDNHYKSSLSTHQHGEVNVCLLPRSARSAIRLATVRLFAGVNRLGRRWVSAVSSVPALRRRLRSAAPAAALGLDLAWGAGPFWQPLLLASGA